MSSYELNNMAKTPRQLTRPSPGCNGENNRKANFSTRVLDVPFCFMCCRFRSGNFQDQKWEIGARKDKARVRLQNALWPSGVSRRRSMIEKHQLKIKVLSGHGLR